MRWTATPRLNSNWPMSAGIAHRIRFDAGVILLTVGFFLQLVVAAWPMLNASSADDRTAARMFHSP